jgi:phosphocarrier protein HPr
MVSKTVKIVNKAGLHLKPAARFCQEALKFQSTVTFTFGNTTANAKSVLSVLGACVKCGDEIEIVANGEDEAEAVASLVRLVQSGLEEDAQ